MAKEEGGEKGSKRLRADVVLDIKLAEQRLCRTGAGASTWHVEGVQQRVGVWCPLALGAVRSGPVVDRV